MHIKNGELESLITFLDDIELAGRKSRMRTKLIKVLTEHYKEFVDNRNELLKEHAKKDDEGEPIKHQIDEQREHYDIEDMESFNKDFNELLNEEVVVEENESNKLMLTTVRDVVLNYDKPLKGQEATMWDNLCERFEDLDYPDEE